MNKISYFILALFLYSCKKENYKSFEIDYSFINLNCGHEIIYEVDSIHIDAEINVYDTIKYFIKERIDTFFYNYSKTKIYRIERYVLNNNIWNLIDVCSCYLQNNRYVKIEENVPYIKLIFPVKEGVEWNGNALNNFEKQNYKIDSVTIVNNIKICKVIHKYYETLIDKYYVYEKYTQNIGMTERTEVLIYSSYYIPGLPIEKRIKRGDIKILKRINY